MNSKQTESPACPGQLQPLVGRSLIEEYADDITAYLVEVCPSQSAGDLFACMSYADSDEKYEKRVREEFAVPLAERLLLCQKNKRASDLAVLDVLASEAQRAR